MIADIYDIQKNQLLKDHYRNFKNIYNDPVIYDILNFFAGFKWTGPR